MTAEITCRIEVPAGSANKYEWDPKAGRLRLDRVLYSPLHYPVNYGYVPETWAEDDDPLDVLVFSWDLSLGPFG